MLEILPKEQELLAPIVQQYGCEMPNIKMSIYKNRRGAYRSMYLFMLANKGICQYKSLFTTDWGYKPISIEKLKIQVQDEEKAW